ncbi:F-box protein [Quillaja saponaria]|uniref:F-box protein n=1 Tax=Quillaja saponaria TaxID=32244 RepID=A0AAD7QJG7_QUISA|nr:F-box protein [Quillaja saponaria]
MNVAELCRPVFDISAPPTSPECMVFVISCCHRDYTISLCTRRDSAWTTKVCKPSKYPTPATNTVFANGIWYCLDESGEFIAFDTVSCSWRFLALPTHIQLSNRVKHVSYAINRGNQVFLCIHGFRRFEIALRDPLEVTKSRFIGGRDLEKLENLFRTDVESAMLELQNVLEVDSFNTGAWCGLCDSDGVMTFRWHHFRSHLDYYYRLNERSCHGNNKNCSTIIMWVEPTWFHPFPNMRWKI